MSFKKEEYIYENMGEFIFSPFFWTACKTALLVRPGHADHIYWSKYLSNTGKLGLCLEHNH